VAASAELVADKEGGPYGTPDFSVATLFFETGPVARLTCSIAAPHDHRIRVIGDDGVLSVDAAWDNAAKVRYRRRLKLRRRLMESPLARRIRPSGPSHPKVARTGAASMNFALGPAEMIAAAREGRPCRLSPEFALHLTEVTLAIQNAGPTGAITEIASRCDRMDPAPWA
jgi:predicted dehydrogenase